jgi:hypothetical protein
VSHHLEAALPGDLIEEGALAQDFLSQVCAGSLDY